MARPAAYKPPSDHEVELVLARLLQVGVVVAAVTVAAGGVLYLLKYGGAAPRYAVFRGEPENLSSPGGILRGALQLRGRGLIQLGLLLLIATPVARVAFSLISFVRQRDRTYVALTAFVLLLLLASLAGVAR